MSSSNQPTVQIGCPECQSTVTAPVPSGPGLEHPDEGGPNDLRGTETPCRNCGHELELYYY
ncbi:hypothetical protein ACFQGT_11715 [Natrialbaceae archaeon GCM10025810]|uniref:hypothetical protein n=1 Tax=Halovalidus salilacus TaxID=3075124 RepID=UPI00361688A9